jgi:hypothetical protein
MLQDSGIIEEADGDGYLTGLIGEELGKEEEYKDFSVYHDHGPEGENRGNIPAWIGTDKVPHNYNQLALLDIAMVKDGQARILIEIEETSAKPKTLLGDIFATVFADHIGFSKQIRPEDDGWKTGACATLIVMVKGDHDIRLERLKAKIEKINPHLVALGASVGKIIIDTFTDDKDLRNKLGGNIGRVIHSP